MSLETDSHISLIDLSKQFNFGIDEKVKDQLCFAETLVISCAHYEGNVAGAEDDDEDDGQEQPSESTCTVTTSSGVLEDEQMEPMEIKDYVEEAKAEQEPEEDDDFHFFFFPDCKKPVSEQHSKSSLIMVDGFPRINEDAKDPTYCKCEKDKKEKCSCFVIIPCKCGAKTKAECTCDQRKEICICDETNPAPVCICGKAKVCTCFPGLPHPVCTCGEVQKPCICHKYKYPSPVCACKGKPKWPGGIDPTTGAKEEAEGESVIESKASFLSGEQYHGEEKLSGESTISKPQKSSLIKVKEEEPPCECQKADPKARCFCIKGKDRKCVCRDDECICGVQNTCVCELTLHASSAEIYPDDPAAAALIVTPDSKTLCECPDQRECICDAKDQLCTCFPKPQVCTCVDPEKCKCTKICDCTEPCICDTKSKECICLDATKQLETGLVCTCSSKKENVRKLKKVRAGKHGHRWCHDVDPHHTFFDYGYGRHDKISYKEQEKEKFKILGLYSEKDDEICPVHGLTPVFKKKVRKPSLDCCSSVGGITFNVETLGEEADKFLVQVVSRASKEGAKTGSKLVSIIDLNLHTLEENRNEHITKKDRTKERKSYMAICQSGYYNKVTRNCGERSVIKRLYHNFEQAKDFLLEGANVVLMRYLAIKRYKGTIQTVTVLIDGTICQSIYVCPGTSQAVVNGQPLFVIKIERHLIHPNGYVHQTLTTLTVRGYIITHEWADNNYMLHINPLLRVNPEKDEIEHHAPLREKWREDLQLLSDFLDFKTTRSSEGARYVAESGRLTSTMKDYLQAILLLKPQDVIHFTRHYFHSALSSLDLPRDDYFDSCAKHVRYYYLEE